MTDQMIGWVFTAVVVSFSAAVGVAAYLQDREDDEE